MTDTFLVFAQKGFYIACSITSSFSTFVSWRPSMPMSLSFSSLCNWYCFFREFIPLALKVAKRIAGIYSTMVYFDSEE